MIALELRMTKGLLDRTARKYHYGTESLEDLRQVAKALEESMRRQSGFWWGCLGEAQENASEEAKRLEEKGTASAKIPCLLGVLTLGAGADRLQEKYLKEGLLTEAYMTEALGNELLLEAYGAFGRWIAENTPYHVARYHFYGGEEGFPLEKMEEALAVQDAGGGPRTVTRNEAFCLRPKMSAVFAAELTRAGGVQSQDFCRNICESCNRFDCSNRTAAANRMSGPTRTAASNHTADSNHISYPNFREAGGTP